VLTSAYIPGVTSGRHPAGTQRLAAMADGGFMDNWPKDTEGGHTVLISAFGGAFDISPTSHLDASSAPLRIPLPRGVWADVSASNLCRLVQAARPADPALAQAILLRDGYDDCDRFLKLHGHVRHVVG